MRKWNIMLIAPVHITFVENVFRALPFTGVLRLFVMIGCFRVLQGSKLIDVLECVLLSGADPEPPLDLPLVPLASFMLLALRLGFQARQIANPSSPQEDY